jgi:glycosyltransferase involved in cell wall biosynthesis
MKKKYDFILFENHFWSFHHYIDLMNLARMLELSGYSVAIAMYGDEHKYCINHHFPMIDIGMKRVRPDKISPAIRKNKFHTFIKYLEFEFKQYQYAKEFIHQIDGLSSNVYAGSFFLDLPVAFILHFNDQTRVFFWGLRSYYLSDFLYHFKSNPFKGVKSLIFSLAFRRKRNLNLFVSNHFIKEEFVKLGISPDRLIIREERTIDELPDSNIGKLPTIFSLLTIGQIRRDKRLEFSINAIELLHYKELKFTIAGRNSEPMYDEELTKLIDHSNQMIVRKNGFLSSDEFTSLIESTHFLLLCDKRQLSTVTNGTMMEALLMNRPIIAPNYLPYSYYVNNFRIGILFEPDDINSLVKAIEEARNLGVEYFIPFIREFQKTILFENAAKQFSMGLKVLLNE